MDNNILSTIRTSRGFSRSVALLVILALLGLTLERVIYFALNDSDVIEDENVVERVNRQAPHLARQLGLPQATQKDYTPAPETPETRFSKSVQGIKDKLAFMDSEYRKTSTEELVKDVVDLKTTMLALHDEVKAGFDATAEHIKKHNLADVIQQRHDKAVSDFEAKYSLMMDKLAAVENAGTPELQKASLNEMKDWLSKQKFKRSQQDFDPNNLPFNSVKPNPDNKPKVSKKEFLAAGFFSNPNQRVAALGDFTFDALPGATDPAYLAETDEVVITQAIRDQAEALEYDPVQIYHWVLNNVEWLPTWGSIQDSDITLGSQKGNAMDISSLLVALLRASLIPARYVHGTIDVPEDKFRNWAGGFDSIEAAMDFASAGGIPITAILSGGQVKTVRMEHIWVEAAIDYAPSRGAKNVDADSWVQMDGSFKQYDVIEGIDIVQSAGIDVNTLTQSFADSGTVNEVEGWVSGLDLAVFQNSKQQSSNTLENFIINDMNDPALRDVIGGNRVIVYQSPGVPSSLSNRIVIEGGRYGALPDLLQQKMRFSFGKDITGYPINPVVLPFVQLNNHKVTLSFHPATTDDVQALSTFFPQGDITDISQLPESLPGYLIKVTPELKVDGQNVYSGNAIYLGADVDFGFDTLLVGRSVIPKSYTIPAGSYLSVAAIAGSVSVKTFDRALVTLTDTQNKLLSNDPTIIGDLTKEEMLGDIFHTGSLLYYSQYIELSNLLKRSKGAHHSLIGGTGSFGYEPDVDYFFGMPRAIRQGGVALNKPIINAIASDVNDRQISADYYLNIGLVSSALEHVIPEILFSSSAVPGESVSSVKAIKIAVEQGQRIYKITSQNQSSALLDIRFDQETMDEISQAINAGKTVITHTDPVSVVGWQGAGYIIYDENTGSGAYKISGGANGSFVTGLLISSTIMLAIATAFAVTGGVGAIFIATAISALAHIIPFISDTIEYLSQMQSFDTGCFIAGLLAPLAALATFSFTASGVGPGISGILSAIGVGGYIGGDITGALSSPSSCLSG